MLALLVGIGFLVEGYDGLFGGDIVCIGAALTLLLLLSVRPVPLSFWRAAAPVLLLLAAGLGWAASGSLRRGGAAPAAPDLLAPALFANLGLITALLCGAILGSRRVPLARFALPLVATGVVGLAFGLLLREAGSGWILWSQRHEGRFLGTLGNANVAAAAYGSLATLALGAALDVGPVAAGRIAWVRGSLLFAAAAAFAAELLTASRTGTALTIVALLAVGAAGIRSRRNRAWLGLALLLGLGALVSAGVLAERTQRIGGDLALRPMMWSHYAAAVADAPFRGHGLGAFGTLNLRNLDTVPLGEALWMVNAPHDIWLGLALQGGLPWAMLTLAAVALMASGIVAALRRRATRLEVGAAGALAIILGLACVDIAFEVPAIAALAMVLAGWLWARALPRDPVGVPGASGMPPRQQRAIAG